MPRPSRACCSPPKHWSRRFLKRKKLLRCLQAAWAAWTTDRQPKQQITSSRARKGSAVLLLNGSEGGQRDSSNPSKLADDSAVSSKYRDDRPLFVGTADALHCHRA